jgi:hypothetical protein
LVGTAVMVVEGGIWWLALAKGLGAKLQLRSVASFLSINYASIYKSLLRCRLLALRLLSVSVSADIKIRLCA